MPPRSRAHVALSGSNGGATRCGVASKPPTDVADGIAGDECGVAPEAAAAMPHSGRIFVDYVGPSQHQATDILTQERVVLPSGVWELVFDECGTAALLGDDSSYRLVDDTFCFEAFQSAQGDIYISSADKASGGGQHVLLSEWMCRHSAGDAHLQIGASNATTTWKAWVFKRPRDSGMRTFGSVLELYDMLSMKTFKSQRSKWAYNGLPQWENICRRTSRARCSSCRSTATASRSRTRCHG